MSIYSIEEVGHISINYAISKLHGSDESFDNYFSRVSLKLIELNYYKDTNKFILYDELKYIVINYTNYSLKHPDINFNEWYRNYSRYIKINKIRCLLNRNLDI